MKRCPSTGDIVSVYAGFVVSLALLCAFGLGVGAIVRNQVGAIIAALAFFFILSPLPELLPGSIGHYFPAQAIGSLHGDPEESTNGLSQVAGGFVLAAWSGGLGLIGAALLQRPRPQLIEANRRGSFEQIPVTPVATSFRIRSRSSTVQAISSTPAERATSASRGVTIGW